MEELLDEAGETGLPVSAKIRYRHPAQPARLRRATRGTTGSSAGANAIAENAANAFELIFDPHERGIAPGQAVVAYAGNIVLGGGTVVRAIK